MSYFKQFGSKIAMGGKRLGQKLLAGGKKIGSKIVEHAPSILGALALGGLGYMLSGNGEQAPAGPSREEGWIARDLAKSVPKLDLPPSYSELMRGGTKKYPLASRPATITRTPQEDVMGQWLQAFTRPSN